MKILDWYIIKKYLSTFIFVVGILMAIIVVIDVVEKMDDFIKRNAPLKAIIFDYYLNFIPYYANLLSPITVFIATVFVTAQLAARTEIIAILSSGVSFRRVLVPYLIGSCVVGAMIFYLTGWVIPNANKTRLAFEKKYTKDQFYFSGRNIHRKVAPDLYVYLESYDNSRDIGYRFTEEKIIGTEMKAKLFAQSVTWIPEKSKWKLTDYRIHTFDGLKETISSGIQKDTIVPNLVPADFGNNYMQYETYTLTELEDLIGELIKRGDDGVEIYQIEKYLRFTSPFAIMILTMMGVIVSARKSRQGVGFQIAFGFVLAFAYILIFIMGKTLAQIGSIPPMVAVWIPNFIFAVLSFILYFVVPR
ncbi:LptF/LptG family permease [Cytophagaceae bacterium DM2B3-1]|uniref:LptF/LptG family permease n=1 Tax=Xanthocytophaga flava TaxID=3048013 RepID=A0AAE3QSR3_9BACT|nr:LptF/LptG family permease [Xanthocytophaga flavus]MDJ1471955.1 LptF/LptG family permease [Xanthocytophaga flavus]MDJ1484665.1 LptF/LptG family permease [Xanthocytophaga flavus]MDJ1496892.1 LptF/LptG family permease [Xanthocytophaga flavus]